MYKFTHRPVYQNPGYYINLVLKVPGNKLVLFKSTWSTWILTSSTVVLSWSKFFFSCTLPDQAGSVFMTQSSIRAFRNWSDRLLEMKTRKVMSCRVQAGASWWEGTDRGKWYRSVLRVPFYHILPLPGVPLHSVWTGSVRDVAAHFTKIDKISSKKTRRYSIKLNWLYWVT